MTVYEKCLFQWTEINLYALELRIRFEDVPFLRIKFEDLMNPASEALQTVADFLGLPFRNSLLGSLGTRIEAFRAQTDLLFDWRQIFDHPNTVALSRELGYDLEEFDDEGLVRRYRKPFWLRILVMLGRPVRKIPLFSHHSPSWPISSQGLSHGIQILIRGLKNNAEKVICRIHNSISRCLGK